MNTNTTELNQVVNAAKELNPKELEAANGGNFFTDIWDKTVNFAVDVSVTIKNTVKEIKQFGAEEACYIKNPPEKFDPFNPSKEKIDYIHP